MKNMKCIFLSITILVFFSIFYGEQIRLERQELSIDYKNTGFIRSISDYAMYNGCLFIVDNQSNRILKFKLSENALEFMGFIGKPGQGPGDLERPLIISIWNNIIAVRDQSGISLFSMDGRFINKFRLFSPTLSFAFFDGRIYCAAPNPNAANLIEVYSDEGKMLFSFADKNSILPNYRIAKAANSLIAEKTVFEGKLIADKNGLYYINQRFGKLLKYSYSGLEISRTDMGSYFGENEENMIKENEKLFLKQDYFAHSNMCPEYFIFRDARLERGRLYFLADLYNISKKKQDSSLKIICIDAIDFHHVASYQYALPQSPNLFLFFLAVLAETNSPAFIIDIQTEGDFTFYKLKL